jgi:3'-phosphoadenosine 5'-phosphosulfate (PAPS) 3'-phosphatase
MPFPCPAKDCLRHAQPFTRQADLSKHENNCFHVKLKKNTLLAATRKRRRIELEEWSDHEANGEDPPHCESVLILLWIILAFVDIFIRLSLVMREQVS